MRKKVLLAVALFGVVALLAGCTEVDQEITNESTGIWNQYFVYPLSWLITYTAEMFGEDYGLSIVLVTVLIRLVLLPLNIKQLRSSKAMQAIQPQLQEIREKYSSKDAKTQQKLQQETMELFQKNGVNPLAGCLPVIVQMPILIAFYHAIMRTAEIKEHSFLWFQLGEVDYILPILAAAFTFLQQKIMMAGTSSTQNQMMPQMTMMLYMMPVMIGVAAFFFPSALALYWVVGNLFMVAQTLLVRNPMMAKDAQSGGNKK
ncbi:YidC family membrane integrase SpoIIIJ [Aquibacillus koreensis]|uniref:Membrane protein insertase YidC n=1 Tax=Aquibacillus koreensis TaxID=279446 RepID=A0A9X4AKE3_9BACI|nr:YidC family membrane integrase SpoIIIJ [Aquibacillus koreensis]MCT2535523.1 YidC family membrane integrase SpoIIIJ [Aquibacillus koreensis]MDC3422754.1 YidC family membrane integrase SpoIIIJ [Aquibacillus koreensis]